MATEKTKAYLFGGPEGADGNSSQKALLGGKGANLAEMARVGLPVPPGFTLPTTICQVIESGDDLPDEVVDELRRGLKHVEETYGAKLGEGLTLSVRSGAAQSMPGMLDTILCLGLNDENAEAMAKRWGDARFAFDCYRRLISMYADVVMSCPLEPFEEELTRARRTRGCEHDHQLTADDMRKVADNFKGIYKRETGEDFPQDPWTQLVRAVTGVFGSWNNERAVAYRRINHIHGLLGTACNVMAMVYGNKDDNSGTGVLFTRSPSNGQKWAGKCDDGTPALYGEFLVNAQGEDVVSGVRTPLGMDDMHRRMPDVYNELVESVRRLEAHQGDAQDIEFTVESGKLYILQTRDAKRTGPAALRIACDLVEEGIATKRHAVRKLVSPEHVSQLLLPRVDPEEVKAYQKEDQEWTSAGEPKYSEGASPSAAPPKPSTRLIGKGLAASPGGATGKIVFSAAAAEAEAKAGRGPVLLVRVDTSPEDIGGMHAAAGVLTATGGMTSHAAVVARGWGKPCVAGCGDLAISYRDGTVTSRRTGQVLRGGDWLSINASEGDVVVGRVKLVDPANMGVKEGGEGGDSKPAAASSGSGSGGDSSDAVDDDAARLASLLSWADSELGESKSDAFAVQANADTPADAIRAIHLGARGIGLTRTEHQWFGSAAKLMAVRRMILSSDEGDRRRALEKMKPYQEDDFRGIYEGVLGATGERLQTGLLRAPSSGALEVPVTVRLLDPPLHEFLPQPGSRQAKAVAEDLGISDDELGKAVRRLHESNPMLGHRGCRLGITKPDVTAMQAAAITRAALEGVTNIARKAREEGWKHVPTLAAQIMVPLVSCEKELSDQRQVVVDAVRGEVLRWHREKETEDEASSSAGGTTESKTAEPASASSSVSRKYSGPTGPGVATLEGLALPSGLVIRVGTMIETPRAALLAGRLAGYSDFFSYGTNDLHQMTYGFSRDDAGTFIPAYIDKGILKDDPFQTVDQEGVGILMDMSVKSGRETAKGRHFSVGVCGEHGGDARSIEFFVRKLKIDYVSCSPMRVPAALLAAAAARIREQDEQAASKKSSEAKVASTESGTKVTIGGAAASGAGATSS